MLDNISPEELLNIIFTNCRKLIKQEMNNPKNYLPLHVPGKVVSVSGNRASVKINGSSNVTNNVPISPHITIAANDEVWIEYINFNPNDKIILCKRPI